MFTSKQQNACRSQRECVKPEADGRKRERVEEGEKAHQAGRHGQERDHGENNARPPRAGDDVKTRERATGVKDDEEQIDRERVKPVRMRFGDALDECPNKIRADGYPEDTDNLMRDSHRDCVMA